PAQRHSYRSPSLRRSCAVDPTGLAGSSTAAHPMTVVMARTHSAPPISQEESASQPPGTASAPNFNHLAGIYRWLEYLTFGPFLWRCRVHFLPKLAHCRRALILGDGDGRFTAHLLRENPHLKITAVDGSPRMIQSLQQ